MQPLMILLIIASCGLLVLLKKEEDLSDELKNDLSYIYYIVIIICGFYLIRNLLYMFYSLFF